MSKVEIHAGDNRDHLRRLIDQGVRVHSVVTDPPYGLTSVQKRFGKNGAAAARTENNDGSFSRLSTGFMGKTWDGTGIERDPEFWKLIHGILLPGGYVFAFGGARTVHWQMAAMEMAGFVIHPLHGWVYGSGFPKSHAADKAIDKMLKTPGRVVPQGEPVKRMIPGHEQNKSGSWIKDTGREDQPGQYEPGSEEAAQWAGWGYGTQAQKPALEPIILAQKPFSEKTGAANLLKHGVGAVNIDGCRVPGVKDTPASPRRAAQNSTYGDLSKDPGTGAGWDANTGRHPANLLHDGSPEVVGLFPDSKDQQGDLKGHNTARKSPNGVYGEFGPSHDHMKRNDSGSAARFFNCFPLTEEDIPINVPPVFYNSKASKKDRAGSKHPTVKPIALLQHLVRHITPPGGVVLDPFAGSGTTAEAAQREGFDCILMESEPEYVEFLLERFPAQPDLTLEELLS